VGSARCAECHRAEAGQLHTHHAHTLARVTASSDAPRFARPSDLYDPSLGITYRTGVRKGVPELTAAADAKSASVTPSFALGSGHLGVTYLGEFQGVPVELRLSYYGRERRWEFTPSQQIGARVSTPVGRALAPDTERGCYACHTTVLAQEGGELAPDQSLLGVGCEACHGPGKAHVEAVRAHSPDPKMPRLSLYRDRVSTELCGQCHRTSQSNDPHDPIVATQLPRLQGLALSQSACFRKSGGRLSCVTCHDPHRDADRTGPAEYDRKCVSCHNQPAGGVTCKVSPGGDCVRCHMPAQVVDLPTNPKFHTHWIKVWPADGKATASAG